MKKEDLFSNILAGCIFLMVAGIVALLFTIEIPEKNKELITNITTAITTLFVVIGTWYFGSSQSSKDKDKRLNGNES